MTDLCAAFSISRKTGYKYLSRYREAGSAGLVDRSRAPREHPNRTDPEVVRKILQQRQDHGTWGAKKILARLSKDEPTLALPARSTADAILKRAGLVEPRRRRRRATPSEKPLVEADSPNSVWGMDFKGHFRVGDGQRCDPLTVTDIFSRLSLECRAMSLPKLEDVQDRFVSVFREYGLPNAILSDNGPPFGSTGIGGLTRLNVWFVRLGILPLHIEPGKPQQNGRHERYHKTLKEQAADPPKSTLRAQQLAFTKFQHEYNEQRPHEALGMRTPAEVYRPSRRPYPRKLPELEYPDGASIRQVRSNGGIKWHGRNVFVGQALIGERVAVECIGDDVFELCFGPLRLGTFHGASRAVIPSRRGHR